MPTLLPDPIASPADELLLKVTPPRVAQHLVTRSRLLSDDERLRAPAVVLVQAPAGFGKTSLLAQWRLEHLARGAVVAWVLAQREDGPQRLVQALALAVRAAAGRPGFGHTLLGSTAAVGIESVTAWLAEVAQTALDVVLFVDEADRLPAPSLAALAYLLRNTPPNLRVVVAARTDCSLEIDDLIDYGQCTLIGTAQLRLQLDETLELVRKRLGSRFDPDAAARLHDLTEGWPLGLQLALSAQGSEASSLAASASGAQGDALRAHFVGWLLSKLDAADLAFLERVAILDHLHEELCDALLQSTDAGARLRRLARDTPIFVAAEVGDWMRLHSLARDLLRERFAALPEAERNAVQTRAADWLAAHGLPEAAAGHAWRAGQNDRACELAERSLYESLMTHGRQRNVLEWLDRLPADEVDRRPRLLRAAAWSLALGDRHEEAGRMVERILAQPGVDDALQCECALILSGAAVFADDPDRFAALHDRWADDPPLRDPLLRRVHANRSAFRVLLEGEPALARLRLQRDTNAAPDYLSRWGDFIVGLSYLWEGQVDLAAKLLRPALAQAEADLGRRSPFAAMLGSLLAAAVWEQDQPAEARALLAHRIDVLERSGLPETVLLGYRTLARIAVAEGAENRALELLGALHAAGLARRLPRLCVASLADQVRLHARRFRPETCRELCARIDAFLAGAGHPQGPLWRLSVDVLREMAHAHAAIAAQDWRLALEALARADALAQERKQGRLHIELLGLRAFALDRRGEKSIALLREAADLAQAYGLRRVFDDTHPALGDWVRQALSAPGRGQAGAAGALAAPMRAPPPAAGAPVLRVNPSTALTPKEREVLELLARNLSNKEIGLAMQVGEATIKWHMKNLFAKLDAGTRKQVVQRARILGVLEAA